MTHRSQQHGLNRTERAHSESAGMLGVCEVQQVAERMLGDYDARRPNALFAERGTGWLTLADAYAVQDAVAALRRARGERCVGYKAGCLSPTIQRQLGLREPVRGYLWNGEHHASGCRLVRVTYANLAVEGEIAVRLSQPRAFT